MGNFDRSKVFSTIFKMEVTTWLSLALAVLTSTTPASSEPRVVCYYTNWSVYRPGTARFNPQNINPYLCTHLIYAFGGFTKDNTLKPFDKYQDIEKGGYAKFTGLKTYNRNLKTLLAIGGWNEGSSRFSPMVASRERRKEFVRNAIKFLRQNHFDGLDLDWEYPAFRDGGKPKDREHYAKLVKELREEFERESEKTGKPRLLLTMAVPAGIEYIQKGFDVKTLNRYLDWMNLLTYDYHSAFEPAVNHHAPLFPLEEPNEYSVDNELNIDYTIKFYLENGADRNKLVLGIPTYGRTYTLFNPAAVEIGSPADGPGEQGDATREKGYLAYYEICEALKEKKRSKRAISSDEEDEEDDSEEEVDVPWTVMYPNKDAMGPVAYKGNQWVGYDDIDIVQKKAEYVAENGLGGIMFWSIDNDDFRGTCHEKPYPLIEAAKEAYISKIGSTDNAVVSERPSSSSNRRRARPKATTTTTTPPSATKTKTNNRKSGTVVRSTTPSWKIVTPEPPTTPDPGSDFKCTDEGFFQHPRDCKKYFWCLDSGPSNLGIVAHQFTCPSGLFFNKAADSCDFARNVLCKKPPAATAAPSTKPPTTTTTRKPVKISTKSSVLFRTTTTTTTTPEPEEEYEDEIDDVAEDAEDPRVIKELIDLIKKVGGVEQLEKQLHLSDSSTDGAITTTPSTFNKNLYKKVLERTIARTKIGSNSILEGSSQSRQRGPQNAGLAASADKDKLLRKDRPQYTTIKRARGPTTPDPADSAETEATPSRARAAEPERAAEPQRAAGKPLQYVNIRRARPGGSTSDTADDTASRNALFERPASFVAVSDTPSSLDIQSARRENLPEYVTIKRQRPTTEEPTTIQYQTTEREEESQETILEKEISPPASLSQPQYTSIVRARATTSPPEEPESPEPTTVLSVQISSLLNSPEPEASARPEVTEATEPPTTASSTTTTTTTTTSTTTPAPPSTPPRRNPLRRRGTTTTTTSTAAPVTTQSLKDRRKPFLRRTKATAPPDTTETVTESIDTETSTNKSFRRGNSKFKSRKEAALSVGRKDVPKKNEFENGTQRPSLGSVAARSERPTRNFARRRLGGANATTPLPSVSTTQASPPSTASPASPSSLATPSSPAPHATLPSRRPFRVAARRRPAPSSTSTSTTSATTVLDSEESLQDIGDTDAIEEPVQVPRFVPKTTVKIQRRPLVSLKDETRDQNPAATNEEERKRQSKKYSSTIKQNQLDELKKSKSQEETSTTGSTTAEDYNAETAVAIAAHQLLIAPVPSIPSYDEDPQPTKKSTQAQTTSDYYTSPQYTDFTDSKTIYSEDFSTPNYEFSSLRNYIPTSTGGYEESTSYAKTTYNPPRTTLSSTPEVYLTTVSRAPASTPSVVNQGASGAQNLGPSTARYTGSGNKYLGVPVEEYGYSTGGYSAQEPSYFTREYLLESPVTKTYDEEYQYLSPVTTPQPRAPPRRTVLRKISTTLPPTAPPATPAPRRTPSRVKPFEKVQKPPKKTYKPIENYDYYDEGQERVAEKYAEGTKVVLHGKGTIECLDIGNFPHPASCKKFISCARIDNGSLLGWEYICPKGLSFDPVGGICNWSAGLGCDEKDL